MKRGADGTEVGVFENPVTYSAWHDERSQREHHWHPTLKRLGIRRRRSCCAPENPSNPSADTTKPQLSFSSQNADTLAMKRDTALPSPPADEPQRLLARLPAVLKMTGLGRSTIYRWIADGSFPPPVRLGPRAVAWRWSDLDRWTQSRATTQH